MHEVDVKGMGYNGPYTPFKYTDLSYECLRMTHIRKFTRTVTTLPPLRTIYEGLRVITSHLLVLSSDQWL